MKLDVYIWPISNPNLVTLVAKDVDKDTALKISNQYLQTNMYDTHLIPTGAKFIIDVHQLNRK